MLKFYGVAAILLAALASLPGVAADAAEQPGLQPGAQAPSFTLQNQNGEQTKLAALLKSGPVALVFHRSADW